MSTERRVRSLDPLNRTPDAPRHLGAGTFGEIAHPTDPSAEAEGFGQGLEKAIELAPDRRGAADVVVVLGLREVLLKRRMRTFTTARAASIAASPP